MASSESGVVAMKRLVCEMCGQSGVRPRRVTRTYGRGATLLLIENVPVIDCPNCGEMCFEAETVREIERIKRERKQRAKSRAVAVASF